MRNYCADCTYLQRWLKDPRHDNCLSHKGWYPMGLIVYCPPQTLWLCRHIEIDADVRLKLVYPQNPRGTGYTDAPINSRRYGSRTAFQTERLISGDITSRLEACGLAGLLLIKSAQKGESYQKLLPEAMSALHYCSGWSTKRLSYSDWKKKRNYRQKGHQKVPIL